MSVIFETFGAFFERSLFLSERKGYREISV
jgi:hypothetical protein